MAERRMFAKTIIDSDAFLDMPQSTQLLYFHLSMRADDDGFINNPKSIMRNTKCNDDDFKILETKKFIIPFESGVVVIKHWKIHNYIAKDRYKETKYKDEKATLFIDENGSYTKCIQPVYILDTQVRLGKDSIGKDSIGKDIYITESKKNKPEKKCFGEYQNVKLTEKELDKLKNDFGTNLVDKAITFFDEYIEEKGYKSKSHNLAIRRWVIDAVKKKDNALNKNNRQNDFDDFMKMYQEEEKKKNEVF